MTLEFVVEYENSLEKFDIGHYQIKVKVTVVCRFTVIQTVRYCYSTLTQARTLILNMNVHIIVILKMYVYSQLKMILRIPSKCLKLIV